MYSSKCRQVDKTLSAVLSLAFFYSTSYFVFLDCFKITVLGRLTCNYHFVWHLDFCVTSLAISIGIKLQFRYFWRSWILIFCRKFHICRCWKYPNSHFVCHRFGIHLLFWPFCDFGGHEFWFLRKFLIWNWNVMKNTKLWKSENFKIAWSGLYMTSK